MKKMSIAINGITDVTSLVKNALSVDGDIILSKGRFCVDGKSLLGVLSIDISTGVTIEYPADAIDFENFITQFEC